jgi:hypothetical protein
VRDPSAHEAPGASRTACPAAAPYVTHGPLHCDRHRVHRHGRTVVHAGDEAHAGCRGLRRHDAQTASPTQPLRAGPHSEVPQLAQEVPIPASRTAGDGGQVLLNR